MATLKINEQIATLRKQKDITQDELAQALGVTNQSVSKWESGACCPDIQLLPEIATYFGISVDELLGYKPSESFGDIYLKIKKLFEDSPQDEAFSIAYRLSTLLHEGAHTKGYKSFVPWDVNKQRNKPDDFNTWGFSACSEPEGSTVHRANSVFIADYSISKPVTQREIHDIYTILESLCDKNTLKILYAIFELTARKPDLFVSINDIAVKSKLSADAIISVVEKLPLQAKDTMEGEALYRIEGPYMILPAILLLMVFPT